MGYSGFHRALTALFENGGHGKCLVLIQGHHTEGRANRSATTPADKAGRSGNGDKNHFTAVTVRFVAVRSAVNAAPNLYVLVTGFRRPCRNDEF